MAKQRDLYKEAIADSKRLKEAAMTNGYKMLSESFKEALSETIEAGLNEEAEAEDEETMEEGFDYGDEDTVSEAAEDEDIEMMEDGEDDLDLGLDSDSEFGEETLDENAGFDEADLQEVLRQVLDEVEHPQLGEMEDIDVDTHDTGLMDEDGKEAGWEEKTPPAKKDWTMKEVAALRAKVKTLALENAKLKKGLKTLKEIYCEVDIFNKKFFCLNKLMDKKVVRENKKFKEGVIKRLDAARTNKEVQGVYESINMAIGLISEKHEPKKGKKTSTLSETLGSQVSNERGVSKVRQDHLLNEDTKFSANRFMVLAGLVDED